jgi:hypothetical protein
VVRLSRHRRRRFTTRASDIDFTVMGFVLVPFTKVLCGPRETTISHDLLVVVSVVVLCLLKICVISNGYLPVTFLGSFITLDW